MRSIISFFLSAIFLNFLCLAEASTLDKAEAAYSAGRYEESTKLYLERALERATSTPSASLFHNLGLSFDRQKELGLAVASYLRAAQLEPRQADFQYNLHFLLEQASDKLEARFDKGLLKTLWAGPSVFLSERESFYAAAIFLLFFSGFLSFALLKPRARRVSGFLASVSALFLLICLSGLSYKLFGEADVGAVAVPKLNAYSGPTESVVIFEIHQGAPFQILNTSGEWVKIELSDQKQGWVKKEGIASFGRNRVILPPEVESKS